MPGRLLFDRDHPADERLHLATAEAGRIQLVELALERRRIDIAARPPPPCPGPRRFRRRQDRLPVEPRNELGRTHRRGRCRLHIRGDASLSLGIRRRLEMLAGLVHEPAASREQENEHEGRNTRDDDHGALHGFEHFPSHAPSISLSANVGSGRFDLSHCIAGRSRSANPRSIPYSCRCKQRAAIHADEINQRDIDFSPFAGRRTQRTPGTQARARPCAQRLPSGTALGERPVDPLQHLVAQHLRHERLQAA